MFSKLVVILFFIASVGRAATDTISYKGCDFKSIDKDGDGKVVHFTCGKKSITCYVPETNSKFTAVDSDIEKFAKGIELTVHRKYGRYLNEKLEHPDCVQLKGDTDTYQLR